MANTKSAKKATRVAARRTEINKNRVSRIRTYVRKVEEAIASGNQAEAQAALQAAQPELMRGAQKGVLHKNTASRKVSRLAARVSPSRPDKPILRLQDISELQNAGQFLSGVFRFSNTFHICPRTDCLAHEKSFNSMVLSSICANVCESSRLARAAPGVVVQGCGGLMVVSPPLSTLEKWKSLRPLGLTHRKAGPSPRTVLPSVYGVIPESGCLGG